MAHQFLAICRNENQELMLKILMSTEFQVLVKRNFPVIGQCSPWMAAHIFSIYSVYLGV